MSFRVLVIPEDPINNGYILRPLAQAVVGDAGKPAAKVVVLSNPRMRGYDHATAAIRQELPGPYGHFDLWLFFPDGDRATTQAMQQLEADLASSDVRLLCCPAQPEVEIYAAIAFKSDLKIDWQTARQHPRFKEEVFDPLLKRHGDVRRAGAGRDQMIAQSLINLQLVYQLCPELRRLRDRIQVQLDAQG